MEKQEIVALLRRHLQSVMQQRQASQSDAGIHAARCALKCFQSERMAKTHADLFTAQESRAAAQFFFNELYGTNDMTQRDADIERVIPKMEKILPVPALQTIAQAIMLDALSESLDTALAMRLGVTFSEQDYIEAYRYDPNQRADRQQQLAYVQSVGNSLCELVRIPFIGSTLKLMRGPAKLAKLVELHNFLERGFAAFGAMSQPHVFVATVVARETMIMDNLYAGRTQPFMVSSR